MSSFAEVRRSDSSITRRLNMLYKPAATHSLCEKKKNTSKRRYSRAMDSHSPARCRGSSMFRFKPDGHRASRFVQILRPCRCRRLECRRDGFAAASMDAASRHLDLTAYRLGRRCELTLTTKKNATCTKQCVVSITPHRETVHTVKTCG